LGSPNCEQIAQTSPRPLRARRFFGKFTTQSLCLYFSTPHLTFEHRFFVKLFPGASMLYLARVDL
jgi:hypothetical protein